MEKVVIIVPTYNEALVIEETLGQIFQVAALVNDFSIHVLVFDSASSDKTQDIVRSLQTNNRCLHLQHEPRRTGLGSAYLQAMRYALEKLSADIVIEFDADLSHQPQYLIPMLSKIAHYDVVMGSRYVKEGRIPKNWHWYRKLLSSLGNKVARLMLTSAYTDFTSGFRITRRSLLMNVLPKQFLSNHYAYKLELLWLLHQHKARIYEFPIVFVDREKGESKLPANTIFDSFRVLLALRFSYKSRLP